MFRTPMCVLCCTVFQKFSYDYSLLLTALYFRTNGNSGGKRENESFSLMNRTKAFFNTLWLYTYTFKCNGAQQSKLRSKRKAFKRGYLSSR